ncbi:MAG TPA: hypothetical protein VJH24_01650 [Candidatus Bilamarchaeaceae archaeon]|nr:hypothetical protein [Candidatus Bilamarchaeaceae archaeon]
MQRLERSPFPGQKKRVEDYMQGYESGSNTWRRHPVLTFRHRLLEGAVRVEKEDTIIWHEPLAEHDRIILRAMARSRHLNLRSKVLMATSTACFVAATILAVSEKGVAGAILAALTAIAIVAGIKITRKEAQETETAFTEEKERLERLGVNLLDFIRELRRHDRGVH